MALIILTLFATLPFRVAPLTTKSHVEGVSAGQMSISPENGDTVKV